MVARPICDAGTRVSARHSAVAASGRAGDRSIRHPPLHARLAAAAQNPTVYVRGVMPKFSDTYTLVVECPWRLEVARHSASVGTYFTSAGEFAEAALARDVRDRIAPIVTAAARKKGQ